ncbi:melatonin receptor type 1B-like [Lytechinus variegatus]|uniref:melatonin receptor type 1B-like n=1 Tax=Lytechinus variegatus TaxID=7654 RepID=UPI001BB1388D|nr:melatonin receptor type 1B-like [Lytechinus variegatus]
MTILYERTTISSISEIDRSVGCKSGKKRTLSSFQALNTLKTMNMVDVGMDGKNTTFLLDEWERDFLSAVMTVMFVAGTTGNVMVLLAVALSRKLQTSTNTFVVSLSVTDLLASLVQPLQVAGMLGKDGWPLPEIVCKIVAGVAITCVSCSVITISMIGVNRFVLITRSKEAYQRAFSTKFLAAMIIFSWMYPIVTLVLPQVSGKHGRLGYDPSTRLCIWDFAHPSAKIYVVLAAVMSLTTFNLTLFSYLLIFRHVRNSALITRSKSSVISRRPSAVVSRKRYRKQIELVITRNLLYVICGFFCCVIPYTGLFLALPFLEGTWLRLGLHISSYAAVLLVLDSCLNPVIYAWKHPHFKVVFGCMVRCRWQDIPEPSKYLARILRQGGHTVKSSITS